MEQESALWESLTEEQKLSPLSAYEESEDDKNLDPLSEIKIKFLR
jgi:hypothetical protein